MPDTNAAQSFTDEFKRDAVAMVLDEGNKIVDVAGRLGVGEGTLGNWVRRTRVDRGERAGVNTSKRQELVELRRENARLRMERDRLKRATALWVRWTRRLWEDVTADVMSLLHQRPQGAHPAAGALTPTGVGPSS
ncbi:MAG: transposase [Acidimicrobiales bacterium]